LGGIKWRWLEERGFELYKDKLQFDYMKSLWASVDRVQAVFCEAGAGTGKTTLAVLAGVYDVECEKYDKLIYVRNAIPVRDIGYLPGDKIEKEFPYFLPLISAMDNAYPGNYEKMI
jgi:predicted ribonuclease YlaK